MATFYQIYNIPIGGMLKFRVIHNTKPKFFIFISIKAINFGFKIAFNRNRL